MGLTQFILYKFHPFVPSSSCCPVSRTSDVLFQNIHTRYLPSLFSMISADVPIKDASLVNEEPATSIFRR